MQLGVHFFPTQFSFQPDELARAAEERGLGVCLVLRTYAYPCPLSKCARAYIPSARVLLANIRYLCSHDSCRSRNKKHQSWNRRFSCY